MRPFAALIAIITGSAVALAVGLTLTWIVLLFLPEHDALIAPERAPLAQAIAIFATLAAIGGLSFYGEAKDRRWRLASHLGMVAMLGVAVAVYWPR